jgi:SAM-dependent methyltransferase
MVEPAVIKKEIQVHYDELGKEIVKRLEAVSDPEQVWRLVEGARPALAYFRRRKITTALALGRFPRGSTILELGCGTGDFTLLLARMGYRMIGADLSSTSIQAAKGKAAILSMSSVSFIQADAEVLSEIADSSVDGVVSFSALRYVPDVPRALLAVFRVLKAGGVAVVDFPNRFCPWFRLLKTHFGVERHIHDHHYSTGEVVARMRNAGFHEVTVRRILFTPYVLPAPLLPVFRAVDRVAERVPILNKTAGIILAKGRRA